MPHLNSVYVIGESRTNADNAITKTYGSFFMAFEIADDTREILDFSCTHTIETTQTFLRKVFLGQDFVDADNWLAKVLESRYSGSSRRAVLASYHDALKRYRDLTE